MVEQWHGIWLGITDDGATGEQVGKFLLAYTLTTALTMGAGSIASGAVGALPGLVTGAATGGVAAAASGIINAAIYGGDVGQTALKGMIGGAIAGGLMGGANGAAKAYSKGLNPWTGKMPTTTQPNSSEDMLATMLREEANHSSPGLSFEGGDTPLVWDVKTESFILPEVVVKPKPPKISPYSQIPIDKQIVAWMEYIHDNKQDLILSEMVDNEIFNRVGPEEYSKGFIRSKTLNGSSYGKVKCFITNPKSVQTHGISHVSFDASMNKISITQYPAYTGPGDTGASVVYIRTYNKITFNKIKNIVLY